MKSKIRRGWERVALASQAHATSGSLCTQDCHEGWQVHSVHVHAPKRDHAARFIHGKEREIGGGRRLITPADWGSSAAIPSDGRAFSSVTDYGSLYYSVSSSFRNVYIGELDVAAATVRNL